MRRIRAFLGLFALLAVGAASLFLSGSGSAVAVGNTLQVPSQYATIQDAVNAANPTGGTIIVQPGTYDESVVITKNNIKILGAPNKPKPVLLPPADLNSGCAVYFTLDGFCIRSLGNQPIKNVEISNFVVQGFPGNGIFTYNVDGVNVHDNIIQSNYIGVDSDSTQHISVTYNTVSANSLYGIYVAGSQGSTLVRQNTVSGSEFGILALGSSHGTIAENTANNNCIGIALEFDFDWTLVHNTANNNSCLDKYSAGIAVLFSSHARLTANTAKDNLPTGSSQISGGIAICLSSSYIQVDHSIVSGNLPGDIVDDGTGNHNSFSQNGVATTLSPSCS